jgi:hypothetical protein
MVLSLCLLMPMDARASQLVSPDELHQDLLTSWNEREDDLATLKNILSTDVAKEIIEEAGSSYGKVMEALPQLSDEELSKLATQARTAQANFAAGISDRELINVLLITLLVVAIVVIVVAIAD